MLSPLSHLSGCTWRKSRRSARSYSAVSKPWDQADMRADCQVGREQMTLVERWTAPPAACPAVDLLPELVWERLNVSCGDPEALPATSPAAADPWFTGSRVQDVLWGRTSGCKPAHLHNSLFQHLHLCSPRHFQSTISALHSLFHSSSSLRPSSLCQSSHTSQSANQSTISPAVPEGFTSQDTLVPSRPLLGVLSHNCINQPQPQTPGQRLPGLPVFQSQSSWDCSRTRNLSLWCQHIISGFPWPHPAEVCKPWRWHPASPFRSQFHHIAFRLHTRSSRTSSFFNYQVLNGEPPGRSPD